MRENLRAVRLNLEKWTLWERGFQDLFPTIKNMEFVIFLLVYINNRYRDMCEKLQQRCQEERCH